MARGRTLHSTINVISLFICILAETLTFSYWGYIESPWSILSLIISSKSSQSNGSSFSPSASFVAGGGGGKASEGDREEEGEGGEDSLSTSSER